MNENRCFKCDRLLFGGQKRYFVTIRITADPDSLTDDTFLVDGDVRGVFRNSNGDIGILSPEDSDLDLAFTLCSSCRRDFGDNPLSLDFQTARRVALLH